MFPASAVLFLLWHWLQLVLVDTSTSSKHEGHVCPFSRARSHGAGICEGHWLTWRKWSKNTLTSVWYPFIQQGIYCRFKVSDWSRAMPRRNWVNRPLQFTCGKSFCLHWKGRVRVCLPFFCFLIHSQSQTHTHQALSPSANADNNRWEKPQASFSWLAKSPSIGRPWPAKHKEQTKPSTPTSLDSLASCGKYQKQIERNKN